jgi:hypothetical protein
MGGSGGGGFFYEKESTPEKIIKKIRSEEEDSRDAAFDTEVAGAIRTLLSNVNDRDTDTIQTHLETIKGALESELNGYLDLRYGGSVSKHTYVNGLSDIDSLAILNKSELADLNPDQVKDYFIEQLRARLPNTEIRKGNLAVTVIFSSGFEVQILPCLKRETGIRIPSSRDTNSWSPVIQPENFVKALRYVNTKMSGKLVPVIKLAKSIISSFPENRQLSGYHVEALAVEIFAKYSGEISPKSMLKYFFNEASRNVLSYVKDKTGQSTHVDEYLGNDNSLNRKMASDSLSTTARKMQNADRSRDLRFWDEILK